MGWRRREPELRVVVKVEHAIYDEKWGRGELWHDRTDRIGAGWEASRNLGWVTRRRNIEYVLHDVGRELEAAVDGMVDGVLLKRALRRADEDLAAGRTVSLEETLDRLDKANDVS